MGRTSNRVRLAIAAGLALSLGAVPAIAVASTGDTGAYRLVNAGEDDEAAVSTSGQARSSVAQQGPFRIEYDRYGWLDRAVYLTVEEASGSITWTTEREGAAVSLADAVSGSLDNEGGAVTFRDTGYWAVVASDDEGDATVCDVTVLPNVSAEVAAPEFAAPGEKVSVALDGSNLNGCHVRWNVVDSSGTIYPYDEVAEGELDENGGEISIGEAGAWNLMATVTDVGGRVYRYVTPSPLVISESMLTGTVEIDGEAEVGSVLTAVVEGLPNGAEGSVTWYVDDEEVARGDTYLVRAEDAGHKVHCVVRDGSGMFAGYIESNSVTVEQVDTGEELWAEISIFGKKEPGEVVYLESWKYPDDADLSVTWYLDGKVVGTGGSYLIKEEDVGHELKASVTDANGIYSGEVFTSGYEIKEAEEEEPGEGDNEGDEGEDPAPVELTGKLAIEGTAEVGQTLLVSATDVPTDAEMVYTWFVDSVEAGSGTVFMLTDDMAGKTVVVRGADASGTYTGTLLSSSVTVGEAEEPEKPTEYLTGTVKVSGKNSPGGRLAAAVTDAPYDADIEIAWLVDGKEAGTGSAFLVRNSDVGKRICAVAEDTSGKYAGQLRSSDVVIVEKEEEEQPDPGEEDPIEITVSISGKAEVGSTLTANVSGAPADARLTYTWYVGGVAAGTGRTFKVRQADAGKAITVEVSDSAGLCAGTSSRPVTVEDVKEPEEPEEPDTPDQKDGFVKEGGKYYYYQNGKKVTGEKKIGGHWYYFDKSTGVMAANKWVFIDKAVGDENGKHCYYDEDGHMLYGQQYLPHWDGSSTRHWYFLNEDSGAAMSGWWHLDGDKYNPDGKWVYYDDDTCQMLYGEQLLPKNNEPGAELGWYWLDENTGACVHGWWTLPDGRRVYYHPTDGYMIHGWTTINGVRTRFNDTTGELQIQCDERVIMCQAYGPWAEQQCGPTSNIRISGCGAASVAHAVSLIKTDPDASTPNNNGLSHWANDDVTPGDVVNAMSRRWPNNGYYLVGDGIKDTCMKEICESEYGLKTGWIDRNRGGTSVSEIKSALEAGKCVIISSIGPNGDIFSAGEVGEYWSSGGHYICFYQYKDGLFWAKDSGTPSGKGNACKYTSDMMLKFLAASPNGTCFWVGN